VARLAGAPLVLKHRALRIHAYADARLLARAAALSLLAAVALSAAGTALGGLAAMLFIAFLFTALVVWLGAAWGASRERAVVRVSDALHIDAAGGRLSFPLPALRRAHLSRSADALVLHTDRGVVLRLLLRTLDEPERLLDAIAAGGAGGTWTAPIHVGAPGWVRNGLAVALAAPFVALAWTIADPAVALAVGVLAVVSFGVLAMIRGWPRLRADVVLGADGVVIRRGARERFIPLARTARVLETDAGAELVLAGGERLELAVVPPWLRPSRGADLTPALAQRRRARLIALLRDRVARARRGAPETAALLARRGRPLPAWRAALRALIRDAAGYRSATLPRDHALEVVEDGLAPVELRIAAALALSPGAGGDAAPRLRVAIDGCASRDVRVALEQAAEGELDEPTLQRALRCEAPAPPLAALDR